LNSLESYIKQYDGLGLENVVDYLKFSQYALTAHSTQIEGATLTIEEASLLLDEGITPKGKPLEHSLMVKDHHDALNFAMSLAGSNKEISIESICELNALVMKSTGQVYHTPLGSVDASKGEIRKGSVFVQNRYFPDHTKVPSLLKSLCDEFNERLTNIKSIRDKIDLSYAIHFNLVSIHPFYDGNGRTSRLLMNQLQRRFGLPLSVVYKEDRLDYFAALEESRKEESLDSFRKFMDSQYIKYLTSEIELFLNKSKDDRGLAFLF